MKAHVELPESLAAQVRDLAAREHTEYAAEQKISEAEALNKGMEEKSREFVEKGAEIYAKA